jgi:rubrerythrin
MNTKQLEDLILQSLEHEMGGVKVYEAALSCAVNSDLKREWSRYLEQTRSHVSILEEVCRAMKIDAGRETPSRQIVRAIGAALVDGMKLAKSGPDPGAAEIVACEAIVLAETKDHLDWELLSQCAEHLPGPMGDTVKSACETVEDQEDEHLYQTRGWCRELWIESLGFASVLPPPEERHHVKTAIGAARAQQAAEKRR